MAKMNFQFLDVGMGDGTLVIMGDTPATQELALIDFGVQPFTKFKVGADDSFIYLVKTIDEISQAREKEVPYLDHVFITHPDRDHYNRIMPLIEANYKSYGLKNLTIGKLTYGGANGLYKGLIKKISDHVEDKDKIADQPALAHSDVDGIDGSVDANWFFAGGKIKVYLLNVNYPNLASKVPNPLSLCLMFADQSGNKVIFMGDAEEAVENQIIENFATATDGFLNAYALKLGHHGSKAGTSENWIKAVKPKAIFASGDFVWAHPYCATINKVIEAGTLNKIADHWYGCGESGKEYFNVKTKNQVFLNPWYVVKKATEKMTDSKGKTIDVAEGVTFGVQWGLQFDGTKTPAFFLTDTASPAKPGS